MNKDEIDLSAYPSYIGVRSAALGLEPAETRAAVVPGLVRAAMVGLAGVALGAVVARQTVLPVNLDTLIGALTSAAMVVIYARAARVLSRRGLVALLTLVVVVLVLTFVAIMVSRSWYVYDLLAENFPMPFTRDEFISRTFTDDGFVHTYWNLLFPFTVASLAGTSLALWKVRRRTEA